MSSAMSASSGCSGHSGSPSLVARIPLAVDSRPLSGAANEAVDLRPFVGGVRSCAICRLRAKAATEPPNALRARIIARSQPERDLPVGNAFAHPHEDRLLFLRHSAPQF